MPHTMKAVGYQQSLPIDDTRALMDIECPMPEVSGHDLLIEVKAIAVNPVDTKVRRASAPLDGAWKVLGWDAAGIVKAVGPNVSLFEPGDAVWYAGDITRAGSNAEYQLVDERIVGRKPDRLSFAEAAALPLTSITAWEMLFERLGVRPGRQHSGDTLLVIGAAGGVGSILVQLARRLTDLTVIGTASRQQSRDWLLRLGAHHVIDHSQPLSVALKQAGLGEVSHVVSLTHSDEHLDEAVKALRPQGKYGLIDDPESLNVKALKSKSLSLHWESMFTRSTYRTDDMIAQHRLLDEVADLVDSGIVTTTLGEHFGEINAENLRRAHALLESGKAVGKIVLEGFGD